MTISVAALVRILLSVVALLLAAIAAATWRRRTPEAKVIALLMAAAAVYCFGYAGEAAQTSLSGALFWLHVEYFGIPWIPALWLVLARKQNGLRVSIWLIFAIPLLTFIGELSNSFHGLYDSAMTLAAEGPFWVVSVHRGPLAWLNLAYLFFSLPYGSWLYLSRSRASSGALRSHTLVMVASGLLPLFGYLLYFCGWSPWGLDLAPITLAATVLLGYLAVFRFECFDLVPMARSLLFHSMRDAAVVTDMEYRLVEFNPAALHLLPGLSIAKPGDHIAPVFDGIAVLSDVFYDSGGTREVEFTINGEVQYFEVQVFPLQVEKYRIGWTAIFANITARRRLLDELRRDAETDELTGVANRRSFVTALERESARSVRYHLPFSVFFVDLDYFKEINDRFGHAAGDSALFLVADQIARCLRSTDLLSRYGGDEFVVLLPQTGLEAALEVTTRIRSVIASSVVEYDGQHFGISVSIGLASCDSAGAADWKRLLDEADHALYSAKASGRNRVATNKMVQTNGCEL